MKHEITSFNTKKMLAESMKKIMKQKKFSRITVSEIVADCGLNRKTFYYHFEDIYALLKWTFENETVEVLKQFNLVADYEEAILFIMNYAEENEYIINCAYDSIGRDEMKRFFFSDFKELVFSAIDRAEKDAGKTLEADYKEFLCFFYTEALTGILTDWIKNRKEKDRQQVMQYLVKTLRESLLGILDRNI